MNRRSRTGQVYSMPDENLQKILQDSKKDFLEMLDRLDAKAAADREKFDLKMAAELEKAEKRLAADRKEAAEKLAADREMAEARQHAAYERLAQERRESEQRLAEERKEAERRFKSWLRWLVATFVSATIAMLGVVASLLISNGYFGF